MLRYRVEIAGEGPVGGQVVRVVLGHHDVRNPRLALRCLRGHALHIAEGLDPSPEASWLGSVRMQRVSDDLPVPAFFRTWCDDEAQQEAAMTQLAAGKPHRRRSHRSLLTGRLARTTPDPAGGHARCHGSKPHLPPLRPPTPQKASPCGEEGPLVARAGLGSRLRCLNWRLPRPRKGRSTARGATAEPTPGPSCEDAPTPPAASPARH